jgi:hypothetical protein
MSLVGPLLWSGIYTASVYVPASIWGKTAFMTVVWSVGICFIVRLITNWIPGFPGPAGSGIGTGMGILEFLIGLAPAVFMYYKFGWTGVGYYVVVGLIPLMLLGLLFVGVEVGKSAHA